MLLRELKEKEMKYYLILSSGAYSDYSPIYFVGEKEITQDELQQKAYEIGNKMWEWFENLPEKESVSSWDGHTFMSKYDPENPNKYISNGPDDDEFIEKMTEWLSIQGYEPIPRGLPEINVYYDVPRTPN